MTAIRAELVLLDTMTGPGRVEYARRIRRAYTELKKKVYAIGRSVALQQTEPNLDSLELELRRLLDD